MLLTIIMTMVMIRIITAVMIITKNSLRTVDLLSIFPFQVCDNATMDIDETSVNAVISLLLAFTKHLLTRHIFYLTRDHWFKINTLALANACCGSGAVGILSAYKAVIKIINKTSYELYYEFETKLFLKY